MIVFADYEKLKAEGKSFNRFYNGYANLSRADLSGADLRRANLSGADLSGADLSGADLRRADLSDADLSGADLSDADLSDANLSRADLSGADLSDANLSDANLSRADLSGADLRRADLSGADLRRADLSGAVNILSASDYLEANFEFLADGSMVVYKSFGTNYAPPEHWKIEAGAILSEICNPDRGTNCGCGVNVARRNWSEFGRGDLWKCVIKPQWLGGVVVPFGTDGKIRSEKVQLVEIVEAE